MGTSSYSLTIGFVGTAESFSNVSDPHLPVRTGTSWRKYRECHHRQHNLKFRNCLLCRGVALYDSLLRISAGERSVRLSGKDHGGTLVAHDNEPLETVSIA